MMDETEKLRKDDGLESGMHSQSLIVYLQHKTLLLCVSSYPSRLATTFKPLMKT